MLDKPRPTLTAAPASNEAAMIISHIFRVNFMLYDSKG
jgi:hypothetical protein